LHYPKDKKLVSFGLVKNIISERINHYCNTEEDNSGSPILLLNNFKIIGVHYGGSNNKNCKLNYVAFIKYIINKFSKKYENERNLIQHTKKENVFGNIYKKNKKSSINLVDYPPYEESLNLQIQISLKNKNIRTFSNNNNSIRLLNLANKMNNNENIIRANLNKKNNRNNFSNEKPNIIKNLSNLKM